MMRFGAKPTLIGGLALVAAGLLVFRSAPANAAYLTNLLPAMLLLGVGAGLVFPALMTLAMSGATPEDSGLRLGLVNTTQQVGGALGLAVLATLSTTRTGSLLHARRIERRRVDRRLSPRVHDRRGAGAGRDRDRPGLPAARTGSSRRCRSPPRWPRPRSSPSTWSRPPSK